VNNAQQANPLTGLPGNAVIQYQIEHVLNSGKEFSVLYLDLDNFKAYNDVYGFDRGDAILQFLAELIQSALSNIDIEDSFIGHLGGDDFVAVLNQRIDQTVLDNLLLAFDARILEYYDEEDRQRGYIYTTNRRGNYEKFPFISLSIAVVTEDNGVFDGYHSVAKRASDVKKRCKAVAGSCYFFDRRN
jgi:diguanylate cyclase (GGDEF)-like protein